MISLRAFFPDSRAFTNLSGHSRAFTNLSGHSRAFFSRTAPLYQLDPTDFKICHLNARSLHKHIDDVRKDFNYNSCDVAIFTETRFSPHDNDEMYAINGFQLFRNNVQK